MTSTFCTRLFNFNLKKKLFWKFIYTWQYIDLGSSSTHLPNSSGQNIIRIYFKIILANKTKIFSDSLSFSSELPVNLVKLFAYQLNTSFSPCIAALRKDDRNLGMEGDRCAADNLLLMAVSSLNATPSHTPPSRCGTYYVYKVHVNLYDEVKATTATLFTPISSPLTSKPE